MHAEKRRRALEAGERKTPCFSNNLNFLFRLPRHCREWRLQNKRCLLEQWRRHIHRGNKGEQSGNGREWHGLYSGGL